MKRIAALLVVAASFVAVRPAAAATPINLGTAAQYSVLGGQTVTNTGPTTLAGGLGVAPGSAFTGFPPGTAAFTHAADAQAQQAQNDLTTAYNAAAAQPSTGTVSGDIVGQTFVGGVYTASSSLFISGTVTLNGQGNPNTVFIFQTGSTLISASASRVALINGAQACNVWWQVGSSATLGTGSTFVGTIMALTSITVTTNVTVEGRALARNGSTTLDSDVFRAPGCTTAPPPTTVPTTRPAPPTTRPATTVPGATTVVTVPGATTTATTACSGCAPPTTSIRVTTTDCHCTVGSTPVTFGGTGTASSTATGGSVTASTAGTGASVGGTVVGTPGASTPGGTEAVTPSCVPKPKKSHEVLVGAGCAAVAVAGCAGGSRLLRSRRHRLTGKPTDD